jgi:hypothetical protein
LEGTDANIHGTRFLRHHQKSVLLVGYSFSRSLACVWLAFATLVAIFAGTAAGVVRHNFDIGLAVGSGVLGVLTAVQALTVYLI